MPVRRRTRPRAPFRRRRPARRAVRRTSRSATRFRRRRR